MSALELSERRFASPSLRRWQVGLLAAAATFVMAACATGGKPHVAESHPETSEVVTTDRAPPADAELPPREPVSAAAPQAEFVPGELVIRVEDPEVLTTATLLHASNREDFSVGAVECVLKSCRVVLRRLGAAPDRAWTREVADAVVGGAVPGILSVELNTIARPR